MIARKLLVAMFALMPVAALAQSPEPPTTPPDTEREETVHRPRQFGRFASPSDDEVDDAMAFMRENAPNRTLALQMLPDDGTSLRRNVMGFMVARYRMLEGIKREDPKLYETKVAQLRVEDELYGLLSSGDTPEEREKMRDQITRASRRLYELSLEERQQRIERLKEFIEREQNDLAVDRSQIDAMVNARVEVLIQEGQSGLRKDVSRRDRRRDRERTPSTHPGRQ